jgi:NitT/TauT family transport system substrate-binding protein
VAQAQVPDKLTIAVSRQFVGSALVHLAARNGYFRDAGLDVTMRPYTSGAAALKDAMSGDADVATAAEVPSMFAIMRGTPLSFVATISTSGEDTGVVAWRNGGVGLADLKGRRVAATPGTSCHYVLDLLLIASRVPPSSVTFIGMAPEKLADALGRREVDAVCAWEPFLGQASAALGRESAVFLAGARYRTTFNIVGRREVVLRKAAGIERLLRALVVAEQFIVRRPVEATGCGRNTTSPSGSSRACCPRSNRRRAGRCGSATSSSARCRISSIRFISTAW